jgi:hypothetical protein
VRQKRESHESPIHLAEYLLQKEFKSRQKQEKIELKLDGKNFGFQVIFHEQQLEQHHDEYS